MENKFIEKRKADFEENCRLLDFDLERGIYALVLARESFSDYVLEMRESADRAEADDTRSEKFKEICSKYYEKTLQAYLQFANYVTMMYEMYEENKDENN